MRGQTGCFGHHRHINVANAEAFRFHPVPALLEETKTAYVAVLRITHPKVVTDIPFARSPEHRIDHGMRQDVGV